MNLEQIRKKLQDRNLSYVAREIGMSRQQLWAIIKGRNTNPTIKTMRKIQKYFDRDGQ